MDNQRVFIWVGVALVAYMNYAAYEHDYGTPFATAPVAQTAAPAGPEAPTLPTPATQLPAPAVTAAAPAAETPKAEAVAESAPAQIVHVRTDVLDLDISTRGAEIDRTDLLAYPQKKADPNLKVRMFDVDAPERRFVFRSGLSTGTAGAGPDGYAMFSTPATSYVLADGKSDVEVPFTWTDGAVKVVKTFVLHRGSYAIDVRYAITNDGTAPWTAFEYGELVRHYEAVSRSMWNPETYAYRGPAMYDGTKYSRLTVEPPKPDELPAKAVAGGWAAAMQHHFVAAYVPNPKTEFRYGFDYKNGDYKFSAAGPMLAVAPGATAETHSTLFVGPKLTKDLEAVVPSLSYTNDYGKWLTPLAKPLFWALSFVHKLFNNWGVAIVLVTLLIKLVFYKLAETSGRSMARMRNLQPRMKDLQERYKDNREELGKHMMELYKKEKINPVAGCLPMVVQIPVFFAFYQVLLESVEMRHAPFLLWIQDLTSRDPYFILPALMGVTMYAQFKMNPASPDPMQQKIFAFMPLVMTATMMFLPAGLVVYMITNMGLSILQQWHINKVVAKESTKARN